MSLADQWVDAVRQIVAETLASQAVPLRGLQATVTGVDVGAAEDGGALVTVSWNGTSFAAAHLASYAPSAGDQVLVLLVGADPVVVGRVVGTPPLS